MLDAMGWMRGRKFRGKNSGIGGEERVELRRTSLERGEQWRGVSGGGRKQRLEGRGEQNLTAVSNNKEVMSSLEIST